MKYILIAAGIFCFASCSQKTYTTNVSNNATTEEGSIRISSNGKGANLPQAYDNAIENAFSTLLYRGIPESVQSTPLIPNETTAKEQYPTIMACFKDKNCYSQFLTHAAKQGDKERIRGDKLFNYEVKSDVTINIRALRTYLEQNNVIRKFGF